MLRALLARRVRAQSSQKSGEKMFRKNGFAIATEFVAVGVVEPDTEARQTPCRLRHRGPLEHGQVARDQPERTGHVVPLVPERRRRLPSRRLSRRVAAGRRAPAPPRSRRRERTASRDRRAAPALHFKQVKAENKQQ